MTGDFLGVWWSGTGCCSTWGLVICFHDAPVNLEDILVIFILASLALQGKEVD